MNKQKNSVLIVEDEKLLLDMYRLKFTSAGFRVVAKSDAESTIVWLNKSSADLAIIDVMLPGMNGLALIKHIRENPKHKKMRILILTNLSESDVNMHHAIRESLQVDGYFVKSRISPAKLVSQSRAILK